MNGDGKRMRENRIKNVRKAIGQRIVQWLSFLGAFSYIICE